MQERRVCVVSGSASGIGAATVRRCAHEGRDVASVMRRGSSLVCMASKGALNALTVGLARARAVALAPAIRVNAIAPGFVESPWLMAGLGEARYETRAALWRDSAVVAAMIVPEDVADAACWLGAGAARTTGEVLLVDAGFRITKA